MDDFDTLLQAYAREIREHEETRQELNRLGARLETEFCAQVAEAGRELQQQEAYDEAKRQRRRLVSQIEGEAI